MDGIVSVSNRLINHFFHLLDLLLAVLVFHEHVLHVSFDGPSVRFPLHIELHSVKLCFMVNFVVVAGLSPVSGKLFLVHLIFKCRRLLGQLNSLLKTGVVIVQLANSVVHNALLVHLLLKERFREIHLVLVRRLPSREEGLTSHQQQVGMMVLVKPV